MYINVYGLTEPDLDYLTKIFRFIFQQLENWKLYMKFSNFRYLYDIWSPEIHSSFNYNREFLLSTFSGLKHDLSIVIIPRTITDNCFENSNHDKNYNRLIIAYWKVPTILPKKFITKFNLEYCICIFLIKEHLVLFILADLTNHTRKIMYFPFSMPISRTIPEK